MIQQGVSAGESSSDPNGTGGMSIGRVMDYVEARLEAIKSREDEEDEDEERERKEKDKSTVPQTQSAVVNNIQRSGAGPSGSTKSTHKTKDSVSVFRSFSVQSMLIVLPIPDPSHTTYTLLLHQLPPRTPLRPIFTHPVHVFTRFPTSHTIHHLAP